MHEPERQRSFNSELSVLKALVFKPHPTLPRLLDHDEARCLLLTHPVVQPLPLCKHWTLFETATCKCGQFISFMCVQSSYKGGGDDVGFNGLRQLFAGLRHLHMEVQVCSHLNLQLPVSSSFTSHLFFCTSNVVIAVQYVHRDIEPKHLGKAPDGTVCIIDLGSSAPFIWDTTDQESPSQGSLPLTTSIEGGSASPTRTSDPGRTRQPSGHAPEAPSQGYYSGMCHTGIQGAACLATPSSMLGGPCALLGWPVYSTLLHSTLVSCWVVDHVPYLDGTLTEHVAHSS